MRFLVTDRSGIGNDLPVRSTYIVISIHDTYSPPALVKQHPGLKATLQLAFDDAEPSARGELASAFTLMTPSQADQIWRFCDERGSGVKAIVVHCEAGVSRSPAVAAALCKGMGGSDRTFWRKYQPNKYVYRLMLEAMRRRQT